MNIILMCGGLSTRFLDESSTNVCKITYPINEIPMIIHILTTIQQLNINNKIIICLNEKYGKTIIECIRKSISNIDNITWTYQDKTKNGTGGAILSCLDFLNNSEHVYTHTLVLSGDVPFISVDTIKKLLLYDNSIIITQLKNPTGNGRIIFGINNDPINIVEEKDCTHLQKQINYVNTGNYYLETKNILNLIPLINNQNKANEYYLTDIVQLLFINGIKLNYYELPQILQYQISNINTLNDLKKAEKLYSEHN